MIPKPGKDPLKIENWRPITLINNDAKLLALIFSQRLKPCLDTIIDDCQSGFMKGRHISNNIRLILDLIDYNELLSDNSFILFVDFYKAFDTVGHSFLFNTLDFFGFGDYFKRAVQTLYEGCNSSVKLPYGTTPRFNIERGIKQGDPIAPFLFLLIMQTMALYIKKYNFRGIKLDGEELKCCQLADDTTIFLQNEGEMEKVLQCLNVFSQVSGLRINIKKCDLFPLKDKPADLTEICEIPVKDVVSYLGIKICKNQEERAKLNFIPLLERMGKKFDSWLGRDLSLYGRVLLSKSEGLSRLIYGAMALDVP